MTLEFTGIIGADMSLKFDYDKILGRVAHTTLVTGKMDYLHSFRMNQIRTKSHLVEKIIEYGGKEYGNVAVLGSWNSILLFELMQQYAEVEEWNFFDIDERVHEDRNDYLKANNLELNREDSTLDVVDYFDREGVAGIYDLIINPSTEHMETIQTFPGPLYALTSNNLKINEHINIIESAEELAEKNNIEPLYLGELEMDMGNKRFFAIGYSNA